jgi:sugar-specific transcriptional regulator TrmB
LVPGEPVPAEVKVVITTEKEKHLVKNENTLIFTSENELDNLFNEVKRILQGKEAYEKILIGIDPGEAIGLAALADGEVIEEGNCFSTQEVISSIIKTLRNVNFTVTGVSVKIGNGVQVYRELVEALDDALPPAVVLEVVSEAGTNLPLKKNTRSRRIRHISSAIRIAGRTGHVIPRRKMIAANSRIQ